VGAGLDAIMQGNDVWVTERLEDLDLAIEVLFELLVQTRKLNGFDRNQCAGNLQQRTAVSVERAKAPNGEGETWGARKTNHLVTARINLGKAPLSNLLVDDEVPDRIIVALYPPRR